MGHTDYPKIGGKFILKNHLSPFFEDALRGKPDYEKNSLIRALADGAFCSEAPPLYRLIEQDSQLEMHPRWVVYFQETFGIISGWLAYHWIDFLQSRNPNVPAIPYKVQPPSVRQPLSSHIKRWRRILESSEVRCIYSDEVVNPKSFELDHFVPWSFVCHDQPWNLMPVLPAANASKGNQLPSEQYVNKFINSQAHGLSIAKAHLSERDWLQHTEPFLFDLRLSQQDLFDRQKLDDALNSTLLPMIALAKHSGFSSDWKYRDTIGQYIAEQQ